VTGFAAIREASYEANMEVPRHNLAVFTFGNVSVIDRDRRLFAIKPSGVSYDDLTPADIVIVDLDGTVVDGRMRPSSDTLTHAVLYRKFPGIGGVVHTHSTYAVGWAQALKPIPILGTTHADHATVDIPCTPPMDDARILGNYEEETGNQIVEHFASHGLDPSEVEMVLVGCHGPFTWGPSVDKAVYNAVVLEELARMAFISRTIDPGVAPLKDSLRDKHYERKHGTDAYYGQP
jgi:L-ribulose-5-phosphate 4-epimerase